MKSIWQWNGGRLRLEIEGGSHEPYIGGRLSGLPKGVRYDEGGTRAMMARRAPGGRFSTKRSEPDEPVILSGVTDGMTDGETLEMRILNTNVRSSDYGEMTVPRPSHADYPAYVKYGGKCDLRGGGHFSGRLTAVMTFFGSVCLSYLREKGIAVGAHLLRVGEACDLPFDPMTVSEDDFRKARSPEKGFPTLGDGKAMQEEILRAAKDGDSAGAVIECAVLGLPVGVGEHIFRSPEGVLSSVLFGIPALKGVEFGEGFGFARMRGSEANDGYRYENGKVRLLSNHCGGIAGGMTTGAPLLFRCAFKPTPSIYKPQPSVNLRTGENEILQIKGRHDPCLSVRAVPVVEAAAAIAMTELLLSEN